MKKRKLKKWVKHGIAATSMLLASYIFACIINCSQLESERLAEECDNLKGSMCSYYEIRQFSIQKNDSSRIEEATSQIENLNK